MNEERFNNKIHRRYRSTQRSRMLTGLFLLVIGIILFARSYGVFFPDWFFSWPMILISIGLFSGLKHGFRRGPWFILLIIGGIFLAERISDALYLRPYLWPIVFVVTGASIIVGSILRRRRNDPYTDGGDGSDYRDSGTSPAGETMGDWSDGTTQKDDTVDVSAILSGVKRNIISKQFKGGDIVAIMGGVELNFMKADLDGKVSLDNFTMFGGTKLFVPPDWNVHSNVVAIFGGVDDKRPPSSLNNPAKVLFLEGTCIFGGIEIRSY